MSGTNIFGQLIKAQFENLSSDISSPATGVFYWNTSSKIFKIYSGTAWKTVVDTDSSQVLTGKDIDGGTASNTSRITVPKDTNANLTALTRKQGTLLYDTDAQALMVDDGSALNQVGTGSSGRNYLGDWFDGNKALGTITNSITATGNITASTTLWQASDTSKLTAVKTASSPLRQAASILLDSIGAGAAFVQSPCFLLDSVDLGKPISVSFDVSAVVASDDYQVYAVRYNSGGTYQEQIPIAGTASATSPYSARIPTGTTTSRGFFIAGSTSTDYYVIRFYRNSASDTTDIKIDSLYVGPSSVTQGAGISDWVSFIPTGDWTTNTTYTGKWRKVGQNMELQYYVTYSGVPDASSFAINIPSGYTIDTAAMPNGTSTNFTIGRGKHRDSSTGNQFELALRFASTTQMGCYVENDITLATAGTSYSNNASAYTKTVPVTIANGHSADFIVTVPIVGWSSNVVLADRAVEEYAFTTGTWDADNSTTGYGPDGVTFGGTLTSARTKTVTWATPVLVTDKVILEIRDATAGYNWIPVESLAPYIYQNTTSYGARVSSNSGSSTSQVIFEQYRRATGATYGSAGENWGTSMKWRVRKVSGGAVVGYPIGARNIVGDTSGTTVPAGYIGQVVEPTSLIAQTTATTSEADVTNASITLTAGTWRIEYSASIEISTGSTLNNSGTIFCMITDSANTHIGRTERIASCQTVAASANGMDACLSAATVVNISASTTYKLRVKKQENGTSVCTVLVNAGNQNTTFFATRIA